MGYMGVRPGPGQGTRLRESPGGAGMDIAANHWEGTVCAHRLGPILITLLIAGLLVTFFVMQQRSAEANAVWR